LNTIVKKGKIYFNTIGEHLSPEELVAYSKADLGIDEMYRLEKHIIDCELCGDAIDGLEGSKAANSFVEEAIELKRIIQPKKPPVNKTILLVAASISLLIATSLAIFFINSSDKQDQLAVQHPESTAENPQPSIADSTTFYEAGDETTGIEAASSELEETPEITEVTAQEKDASVTATEQKNAQIAANNVETLDEGIAQEEEAAQASGLATQGDQRDASMAKRQAAPEAAPSRAVEDRELVKSSSNLPEPELIGGNAAWRRYVRKNVKYPQAAIDNNIRGDITALVTINTDGSIQKVDIIEGLGFGCDEEAIRLIRAGSKWQAATLNGSSIISSRELKLKFRP
jgi:outer membrane biosynthesis protein TonB